MKPISIRFQCFGPYRKEMFVDFEELEKKGLFLICGETGAGKTTILDAICYALYGKSSGGLRGDLSVMRCKLAEPKEETIVEFIFDANGKRYCFKRTLRYGRKNLIDEHNCMVLEDGEFVPVFENPKQTSVNKKAEEIIGLNYEQFRQVIILPQGKFETLLVSDSAEKEKILVSLFKAEKWQKIADELYERVAEEDKKLKQEILLIRNRLNDYGCEQVEELEEKVHLTKEHLTKLRETSEQAEVKEKVQKEAYEQALVVNEQFQELAKRIAKVNRFQGQIDEMKQLHEQLKKADAADELRPFYEKYVEARRQASMANKNVADQEALLQLAEQKLAAEEARKAANEKGRPAYEEGVRKLASLKNSRPLYESFAEKKEQMELAQGYLDEKNHSHELAKVEFEKTNELWLLKMNEQKVKMARYTESQNQYLSGISGTLAAKLKGGSPCPVCGSLDHPNPAKTGQTSITEQELDLLNKALQKVTKEVETAGTKRSHAELKHQQEFSEMQQAQQNYLTCKAAYQEAMKQKLEGVDTKEQLEKEVADLECRIKRYEELVVKLQERCNQASARMHASNSTLSQAKEQKKEADHLLQERETVWLDKLKMSEFSSEKEYTQNLMDVALKNKRRGEVLTFQSERKAAIEAMQEQREAVKDAEQPDMLLLRKQMEDAAVEHKNLEKELIIGQQTLEKMEKDLRELTKRKLTHDEKRLRIDENLEFANRLRGRSGVSLQRYVLGVMLSSITTEANRLLKNVHKGRYQLYRTDHIAGAGRKGGLELEVLDTQNQERRSVTTLSGGEKFLVALSLAIGLSTVVQAQGKGMRLGAMFIDEGFGSLDENSIYDALEVLQGIQKASGLVGIISHVELLREVIPSKIEVQKSKEGSWF